MFPELILLPLAQGILEAFPISSSMHLNLLFDFKDSAVMHLGPALAFSAILGKFIYRLLYQGFYNLNKLAWKIMVNSLILTLPTIAIGYHIRNYQLQTIPLLALIAAIIMILSDIFSKRKNSLISLSYKQLLLIGLIISSALMPGVSRMGLTYTTLRLFQLRKTDSLIITLLIGIPISFGAATIGIINNYNLTTLYQAVFSGLITYIFLHITFRMLKFWWIFGAYRIVLWLLCLKPCY